MVKYVMISADYSQVELRIAAIVSQEPKLLNAYNSNKDVHRQTASFIYQVQLEEVTESQRSTGKNTNFAMLYESGAWNLSRKFRIPIKEAEHILTAFKSNYLYLTKWKDSYGREVIANGYAETLLGRKRYFLVPGFYSQSFESEIAKIKREGINHRIQGTSADVTKLAMIKLHKPIKFLGGRLLLSVHDEIVSEVPEECSEEANSMIKNLMGEAFMELVPGISIKVDTHIGTCWTK